MNLRDITVLDLTRLLPGPYATQLLADLGAEVIKVEEPSLGDYARYQQPEASTGQGALFTAVNRGKRSITLDLKDSRGQDAFYQLADDADVVIEQFRPGVVDDLGIGYETLRARNDALVYCSLSGYGQSGPYADRVGHDLNYVGFGGLLDMTRDSPDSAPTIPGFPVADMAGGVFSALSIVSALLSRETSDGSGTYIDVSMMDAVISFSQVVMAQCLYGTEPRPGATDLTGRYPCYDIYRTKDGRYITIAALEPKFWSNLCSAIEREHLVEEHRAEDPAVRDAVREELQEVFASRTRAEWEEVLGDRDVMMGLVNTPTEVLEDDHVRSRGTISGGEGRDHVEFPARFGDPPSRRRETVPAFGEHDEEVLAELGYSNDEIEELRRDGVITDT